MDTLAKKFDGSKVRAVDHDGAPAIVAADVAHAIDYSRVTDFVALARDRYRGRALVSTPSGKQEMPVLTEPGLWQALSKTRKPKAEPFQDWLYEEVLPEIRRTGRYAAARPEGLTGRADALRSEIEDLRSEISERQAEIDARQAKLDEAKAALAQIVGGDSLPPSDAPPQLADPGLPTELAAGEAQADLTDPAVPDVVDAARELVLKRPLVVFDLETTGIKTESARIVQVAMYRLVPSEGGQPTSCPDAASLVTYLDPEEPIPEAASQVNGITTADVTGMPTFGAVADEIADMLTNADLCAYNGASFDIPLLRAEFIRAGYPCLPGPEDRCVVDPYLLERRLMPRSLEAAHQRYTGRELEDAHDADADIRGTWRVLEAQVKRVPGAGEAVTPSDLHDFQRGDYLDLQRKLKRDGDKIVVMFGKHQGSSLSWIQEHEPGYLRWMAREVDGLRPHIEQHT